MFFCHKPEKIKARVMLICKKRVENYGTAYGLFNSARSTVSQLQKHGIEATFAVVDDNNGIDKVVSEWKPTHVVILAFWVVPEKFDILLARHPKAKWFVNMHSKTPFLAGEGIATEWLCGYRDIHLRYDNFWVSANNRQMQEDVEKVYRMDTWFLPNMYTPPTKHPPASLAPALERKGDLHVGCFGAIRPLKNHLMQAMAAIRYANAHRYRLVFHVNGERLEQNGAASLKNLVNLFACISETDGHRLKTHAWLPHEDFVSKLVPCMHLGMQVSLSESFNIVAADFAWAGVPIVGSTDIDWMPRSLQADPTDTNSIISKMDGAMDCPRLATTLTRAALFRHNDKAVDIWKDMLKNTAK